MKKPSRRLQGEEWHTKKNDLILKKWYKNKNGHIKGFYEDKDSNVYTHWLSNDEILDLESKGDE